MTAVAHKEDATLHLNYSEYKVAVIIAGKRIMRTDEGMHKKCKSNNDH